ncbi:MAG: hypothetical protein IJZ38_03150 [Bacteroides sp.]|nr:hypothetical protein [Bacteroides sp.]
MNRYFRVGVGLVLCCLCCMVPSTVYAADTEPEYLPTDEVVDVSQYFIEQNDAEGDLKIDRYDMLKSTTSIDLQYYSELASVGHGTYLGSGSYKSVGFSQSISSTTYFYSGYANHYLAGFKYFAVGDLMEREGVVYGIEYYHRPVISCPSEVNSTMSYELRVKCYDSSKALILDYPVSSGVFECGQGWTTDSAYVLFPNGTEYIIPYIHYTVDRLQQIYTVSFYTKASKAFFTVTFSPDGSDVETDATLPDDGEESTVPATDVTDEKLDGVQDSIDALPDKIVGGITDGLKGLFVPTEEEMADIKDKWSELLSDRFGAVYDSVAIVDEFAQSFQDQGVQETITFPSVSIPLAGTNFVFGGWEVDVVPDGFGFLIETVKKVISVVCTFLFVNGMKTRYEKILEGRG